MNRINPEISFDPYAEDIARHAGEVHVDPWSLSPDVRRIEGQEAKISAIEPRGLGSQALHATIQEHGIRLTAPVPDAVQMDVALAYRERIANQK